MIETSPSIAGAAARLSAFPYTQAFAALPSATRDHLLAGIGAVSPVPGMVNGMEALWAVRDQLDAEGRALAVDLAYQVFAIGLKGKRDRADAMIRWLRADAGEIPAEGLPDAPAAEAKFLPPAG